MTNNLSDATKTQPGSEIAGTELLETTGVAAKTGASGNCSGHGNQGCCGNHHHESSAHPAAQECCGH